MGYTNLSSSVSRSFSSSTAGAPEKIENENLSGGVPETLISLSHESNRANTFDEIIKYINRLSDFLFVAARIENIKDGDILWVPNNKKFED